MWRCRFIAQVAVGGRSALPLLTLALACTAALHTRPHPLDLLTHDSIGKPRNRAGYPLDLWARFYAVVLQCHNTLRTSGAVAVYGGGVAAQPHEPAVHRGVLGTQGHTAH